MRNLIQILLYLSILSDSLGNILIGFSLIIKSILILILLIELIDFKRFKLIFISPILLILSTLFSFFFLNRENSVEFSWSLRILLLTLIIEYFRLKETTNQITNRYFRYLFLTISIMTISSYFIGFGNSMYSDETAIGTRGLYNAGNELSVLLLICTSYYLLKLIISNKYLYFTLYSIVFLIIGVLLSTKSAILGIILLILLLSLQTLKNSISLKKLVILRKKFIFSISYLSTLVFIVPISIYVVLFKIGLIDRLTYALNKFDLLTVIMSGRNNIISILITENNVFTNPQYIFFGVGEKKIIEITQQTTETDFMDFYLFFGIFGLISLFTIIFYMFKTLNHYSSQKKIILSILILISSLSGHVFSSGMAIIPLGLLITLKQIK